MTALGVYTIGVIAAAFIACPILEAEDALDGRELVAQCLFLGVIWPVLVVVLLAIGTRWLWRRVR
jgi:hypothetical protein